MQAPDLLLVQLTAVDDIEASDVEGGLQFARDTESLSKLTTGDVTLFAATFLNYGANAAYERK